MVDFWRPVISPVADNISPRGARRAAVLRTGARALPTPTSAPGIRLVDGGVRQFHVPTVAIARSTAAIEQLLKDLVHFVRECRRWRRRGPVKGCDQAEKVVPPHFFEQRTGRLCSIYTHAKSMLRAARHFASNCICPMESVATVRRMSQTEVPIWGRARSGRTPPRRRKFTVRLFRKCRLPMTVLSDGEAGKKVQFLIDDVLMPRACPVGGDFDGSPWN